MLDAQLTELRRIWRGTSIGPAPARAGGPRVLVGGDARHAGPPGARHGDGWTMMVGTPDDFAAGLAIVRAAWEQAARPDRPATMAVVYAALGADAPGLIQRAVGQLRLAGTADRRAHRRHRRHLAHRALATGSTGSPTPAPTRSSSCPARQIRPSSPRSPCRTPPSSEPPTLT